MFELLLLLIFYYRLILWTNQINLIYRIILAGHATVHPLLKTDTGPVMVAIFFKVEYFLYFRINFSFYLKFCFLLGSIFDQHYM